MKIGQMSFPKLSSKADYIQLDVCGLTAQQSVDRYKSYGTNLPVILHGDWEKKGNSENNIESRLHDYIEIIEALIDETAIIGLTMHPTYRKKVSFDDFQRFCGTITLNTGVSVFIENRSNQKIWLSTPEEIIRFSHIHAMTIDVPQLYISCGYDQVNFMETLKQINWDNVQEVHLANIKRQPPRTFVARKLDDGELDMADIFNYLKDVPCITLEILGGVPTFDAQVEYFYKLMEAKIAQTQIK